MSVQCVQMDEVVDEESQAINVEKSKYVDVKLKLVIGGLTVVDDQLFVLAFEESVVKVYTILSDAQTNVANEASSDAPSSTASDGPSDSPNDAVSNASGDTLGDVSNASGDTLGDASVNDQHDAWSDDLNLRFERKIYIKEFEDPKKLDSPKDFVGCSHNKVLYISNKKSILRVNLLEKSSVTEWKVRENYKPFGISVTSDHNLLVTLEFSESVRDVSCRELIVLEYTRDGEEIREIKIDKSLSGVWKAIELSQEQYLICYYMDMCVINSEGSIIHPYTSGHGTSSSRPISVTVDYKSQLVFVMQNYKVKKFTTDLTCLGGIDRGFIHSHICFDSATDQLFIGAFFYSGIKPCKGCVRGLTVLGDQVFVVHDFMPQVKVYKLDNMAELSDIPIPDMKTPCSLAGCSHHKVLYICDDELKCIIRVNISDGSMNRWTLGDPCSLTVTSDHNVLVVMLSAGYTNKIVKYTSEGVELWQIQLKTNIRKAVELSSGTFIFSIVDYGICTFNSTNQSSSLVYHTQEYQPYSIAMDYKRKILYVLLVCTRVLDDNKIIVLGWDLTYIGDFQTKRSLFMPNSLHFDPSTDHLFIGENSGSVIICPT